MNSKVRFEKFMTALSEKRKYYTMRVKTTLAFKDFKKVCHLLCVCERERMSVCERVSEFVCVNVFCVCLCRHHLSDFYQVFCDLLCTLHYPILLHFISPQSPHFSLLQNDTSFTRFHPLIISASISRPLWRSLRWTSPSTLSLRNFSWYSRKCPHQANWRNWRERTESCWVRTSPPP